MYSIEVPGGQEAGSELDPLRADHLALLAELASLENTRPSLQEVLAPGAGPGEGLRLLGTHLCAHMDLEEKILFPVLVRCMPDCLPTILSLQGEHEELTGLLAEVARARAFTQELSGVLWQDFQLLLREHIRKEEGAVFHLADRFLTLQEKHEIAQGMHRHHAGDLTTKEEDFK